MLLLFMAEHLGVPVRQYLISLLPDSIHGASPSYVRKIDLKGAPEAPGIRAKYGDSFVIGAFYGGAAAQALQLEVRGKPRGKPRGRTPRTVVSHGDRTFYVAGQDQEKTVFYFTGLVAFMIVVQQEQTAQSDTARPSDPALLNTIVEALDLDSREPVQSSSELYDEASVRTFWQFPPTYVRDDRVSLLYDETAPDLLPSDAPDGFSYRLAGLGSVSIALPLPPDWTTITPSGFRAQGLAFVRSADGFDMNGEISISSSSSPMSLQADDNVIVQASVPGRRGNSPDPVSMIEDLVGQAPLQETTVVQTPADTTLSGYNAVRATVRGTDADGRQARYRLFGVSVEGTTLMLAVLHPAEADAETEETIQTALKHLDLRPL